jgi:hypothetical protein
MDDSRNSLTVGGRLLCGARRRACRLRTKRFVHSLNVIAGEIRVVEQAVPKGKAIVKKCDVPELHELAVCGDIHADVRSGPIAAKEDTFNAPWAVGRVCNKRVFLGQFSNNMAAWRVSQTVHIVVQIHRLVYRLRGFTCVCVVLGHLSGHHIVNSLKHPCQFRP